MYCEGKTFVESNRNRSLRKLQLCTVQKHNFVLLAFKTEYFIKHTRRLRSIKWRKNKKIMFNWSLRFSWSTGPTPGQLFFIFTLIDSYKPSLLSLFSLSLIKRIHSFLYFYFAWSIESKSLSWILKLLIDRIQTSLSLFLLSLILREIFKKFFIYFNFNWSSESKPLSPFFTLIDQSNPDLSLLILKLIESRVSRPHSPYYTIIAKVNPYLLLNLS